MNLIEISGIEAGYGGAPILNGVDIAIEQSDIAVIVGPNGAGKSTILKAIFGLVSVSNGAITFAGQSITNAEPDRLVPMGLGFVPQEFNVFTTMTVEENLEMGAYIRRDDFGPTMQSIYAMFPVLKEKRRQRAGELSGGQRQMVAMGRALMSQPKLLLLDEPSAGLSPIHTTQVFEHVQQGQCQWRRDPDGRAERAPCARLRHQGIRHRQRAQPVQRHRPGAARQSRGGQELPRRMKECR